MSRGRLGAGAGRERMGRGVFPGGSSERQAWTCRTFWTVVGLPLSFFPSLPLPQFILLLPK